MSTDPSPPPEAGPSSSRLDSPPRSRAHSLSLRFKSKIPLQPIDADHLSPTSASFRSSVRRVMSYEDDRRANASHLPPLPPPKDDTSSPHDPLLKAAREKLSSQDQEAMRKIRSTMVDISDSGSSRSPSASTSPNSPLFPAIPPTAGPSREIRSRRSTLSKLVVPHEIQRDAATPVPSSLKPDITLDFTLAVIGKAKTGRTTLINRAFKPYGVTEPVSRTWSSGVIGQTYESTVISGAKSKIHSLCHIVELDISALDMNDKGDTPSDEIMSEANGILLCYDSTRRDTFASLEPQLSRLALMGLPVVVFACHSDPTSNRDVDPSYANSIGEPYNVGLIEVSDLTTDGRSKMRNGLRYLVSRLEQRHRKSQLLFLVFAKHAVRKQRKASRDASPSSSNPAVISPDSDGSVNSDKIMWHAGLDMTNTDAPKRESLTSEKRSSAGSLHWIMQGPFSEKRQSSEMQNGSSEIIISEAIEPSPGAPGSQPNDGPAYIALDDLYHQLFSKIVSTEDEAFVKSFFLTYRRFCLPREVMAQFLDRLKQIEGYKVARDVKHWALQKLTGALIDWISIYPGDICEVVTRNIFRQVLGLLLEHMFMAHLTADLAAIEETLDDVIDVDTSWSYRTSAANATMSSVPSTAPTELLIDGEVLYDFESTLVKSDTDTPPVKGSAPSMRTASTTSIAVEEHHARRNGSNPKLVNDSDEFKLYRTPEENTKWAAPFQYVLTVDPRTFAMDLTRMQWQLFAAIRPRGVFRHDFGKERDGPVGKAIDFFNHLSRWVSTIILADPKPKHRARVYERFMLIAHQLRRLNNYDSLYALLSGVNETSIHRLTQTHALIQPNPEMFRDFQSHNKLMDPRGGYTHYRRALSADISHGRSAIPLVTTILAMVNRLQSIRPDDMRPDGTVQWEKFARFGEILSIIPECRTRGPMVTGHPSSSFVSMLNDVPIIEDEDGLFDRSRMLEPAGGAHTIQSNVRRKFGKMAF